MDVIVKNTLRKQTKYLILFILCAVYGVAANAEEPAELIRSAQLCAQKTDSRITRLACFDEVFNTQIRNEAASVITPPSTKDPRPAIWHTIVNQEKQRESTHQKSLQHDNRKALMNSDVLLQHKFLSNKSEIASEVAQSGTEKDRIILTQPAIGTLPPRPILVISCIDNITRLQLLLHKPIEEGVTPLELNIDQQTLPTRWFSEHNGYLIRAGRGLPGIEDIRSMFNKKLLVLKSEEPTINNLSFDLNGLSTEISTLRQACHW